MYRTFKKTVIFLLIIMFLAPAPLLANFDRTILTDPVVNTYVGRPNITPLVSGLAFADLPMDMPLRDAIVRGGALGVFLPQPGNFAPNTTLSRAQAITYVMRAAGFSQEARDLTDAVADTLPDDVGLNTVWQFAYMQLARDMGLITDAEYAEAVDSFTQAALPVPGLTAVQPEPTPAPPAFHQISATREEVAFWLYTAFDAAQGGIFAGPVNQPAGASLAVFTDRNQIAPTRAAAVDAMLRNGIMTGTGAAVFSPRQSVTRGQIAQIIRNIDTLHFNVLGLQRMTGTVGEIFQEQFVDTASGQGWHTVYVRRADGRVDLLQSTARIGLSPQDGPLDAVVLRNGAVSGLAGLQAGDQIEYIVHPATGTVWYVRVLGEMAVRTFTARLNIMNAFEGLATFIDANGRNITYPMIYGMYGLDRNGVPFVRFGVQQRAVDTLPLGSFYTVTLVNNVITEIEFVGDAVLYEEIRGIVIENNPMMGFITILDHNRRERSFNYIPGLLRVVRQDFYDMRESGWGFEALMQDIDVIAAGDIVSIRTADDDPFRITHISAASHTTTRYGRIREFRPRGGYYEMLMEFHGGQTAWFTLASRVLVLQNGVPVQPNRINVGDWAQLRVSQAMLGPGIMMESVLEVALDGGGHHISNIVIGQFSRFGQTQNQLFISNARELTPAGWSNNRSLAQFNIGGANTRYFFDGRQVTLAHFSRYLQRSSATIYMAMENHFAGERVIKVSARSGRDNLLRPELIIASDINGFHLLGTPGAIRTDAATIVVRDGRLVDTHHISANDWARVAMNGHGLAAVVDISQAPATDGVEIIRGRVQRVWPHESFRVETMSSFDGMRWNYAPIPREFAIDHGTIFVMDGGIGSIYDFIGFTEASVVGQVFNVITDGARAAWVIEMPFTEPIPSMATAPGHLMLRGTIFESDNGSAGLRDVTVYNPRTGAWLPISLVNASAEVNIAENAIIIDRNRVISAGQLRVGQQIRVLTATPLNEVVISAGMTADGYIVLVES